MIAMLSAPGMSAHNLEQIRQLKERLSQLHAANPAALPSTLHAEYRMGPAAAPRMFSVAFMNAQLKPILDKVGATVPHAPDKRAN